MPVLIILQPPPVPVVHRKAKHVDRRQGHTARLNELKELRKKAKEVEHYLHDKKKRDEMVEKSLK